MEDKTFWDIFKSRKFWVLVLAILVATAAFAHGNIDGWQYIQALVVALAAYSTGVAIEDAGLKAGAGGSTARPLLPLGSQPMVSSTKDRVTQSTSGATGLPAALNHCNTERDECPDTKSSNLFERRE